MFSERVQTRTEQRAETRRSVLAAADRLFREHGFAATTIRRIAADAGVSVGTVISIGDKDGLLVAVYDDWIDDVHTDRRPTPAPPSPAPGASLADAIVALVTPFTTYFERDPELSRQYAAIIVRGAHPSRIFDDLAVALVAEFEAALLVAGVPACDAPGRARTIYSAYLGIVMSGPNRAFAGRSPLEALRDAVEHIVGTTEHTGPTEERDR